MGYVEGASGLAVAVGKRVVALDLFDKPATCRKVWERLLSGAVMEALEVGKAEEHADPGDVEALVSRLRGMAWEPAPAVGEGEEFRSDAGESHASALLVEGSVVHGSVVVAG